MKAVRLPSRLAINTDVVFPSPVNSTMIASGVSATTSAVNPALASRLVRTRPSWPRAASSVPACPTVIIPESVASVPGVRSLPVVPVPSEPSPDWPSHSPVVAGVWNPSSAIPSCPASVASGPDWLAPASAPSPMSISTSVPAVAPRSAATWSSAVTCAAAAAAPPATIAVARKAPAILVASMVMIPPPVRLTCHTPRSSGDRARRYGGIRTVCVIRTRVRAPGARGPHRDRVASAFEHEVELAVDRSLHRRLRGVEACPGTGVTGDAGGDGAIRTREQDGRRPSLRAELHDDGVGGLGDHLGRVPGVGVDAGELQPVVVEHYPDAARLPDRDDPRDRHVDARLDLRLRS